MLSKYESAVRKLYQVNMWNPVKLGLDNSKSLHKLIGSPMVNKPIVHIAGTNGKGSVAWKIALALRNAGFRDGLFVSPHVASFRERIQIGGELISEDEVASALPWLFKLCAENDVPATFFELTTALAFHHFKSADVVVLETGLGGRLDATNVVVPTLSVITSIGLDHTRILGDTIEAIASEKAGIMKPSVPVLVGPHCPHEVLRAHATQVGSPYHVVAAALDARNTDDGDFDFDEENSAIAAHALEMLSKKPGFEALSTKAIELGVRCRPPCRFEMLRVHWDKNQGAASSLALDDQAANAALASSALGVADGQGLAPAVRVCLDVGHNPPALRMLLAKLKANFPKSPLRFVLGMSRDKDMAACVGLVVDAFRGTGQRLNHVHLVAASHPRAAPPHVILESAIEAGVDTALFTSHGGSGDRKTACVEGSVTEGVRAALAAAAKGRQCEGSGEEEEIVVVCGSVFIMAEARQALGFTEPQDSDVISEVAGSHLKNVQEFFKEESSKEQ